jgi:purine-binding chemotaxis protein CheW
MSDKLKDVISKQQQQQNAPEERHGDDIVQRVGFIIGDEEYAVPILSIQEIIKPIGWTRVPQTPPYVLGVFNLRGSVIPLIDLRLKFGLASKKQDEETRFIVMKHGEDVA